MTDFTAVAESGTEYRMLDGLLRIYKGGEHMQTLKPAALISVPEDVFSQWEERRYVDWEWLQNAESTEVPVVGQRLYVSALREWRLSTPIASVEVL
jgi:hypothetical protein